jgi:hypothetical protein
MTLDTAEKQLYVYASFHSSDAPLNLRRYCLIDGSGKAAFLEKAKSLSTDYREASP